MREFCRHCWTTKNPRKIYNDKRLSLTTKKIVTFWKPLSFLFLVNIKCSFYVWCGCAKPVTLDQIKRRHIYIKSLTTSPVCIHVASLNAHCDWPTRALFFHILEFSLSYSELNKSKLIAFFSLFFFFERNKNRREKKETITIRKKVQRQKRIVIIKRPHTQIE